MRLLLTLAVATLAFSPCRAERTIELVPVIGIRNGLDLSSSTPGVPPAEADASGTIGFGVNVQIRPDGWFESFLDHQSLSFAGNAGGSQVTRFDVAVDYLQFGGRYQPSEGRVHPFVSAAIGLTRFGSNPGDVGNSLGLSGSLGGGVQIPISQRTAFHLEVRGYATIDDAAFAVACGPGCVAVFSGSGWYQFGARAGLAFRM